MGKVNLESTLIAIEPITLLMVVKSFIANLLNLLEFLIYMILFDPLHLVYRTLLLHLLMLIILWFYLSLSMIFSEDHSVSILDIATLISPDDHKSTVFPTFQT